MLVRNLTIIQTTAILSTAGTSSTGRRNLVSTKGEKSPQSFAAFLCLSFSAALCRVYRSMAGCFGHGSSMASPLGSFRPHYSPPPVGVETIGGGYIQTKGVTAI